MSTKPATAIKRGILHDRVQPLIPYIQYLYFTRFSILTAVILGGLGFFAIFFAPTMLGGMLVLEHPIAIVVVTCFAFQVAWVAMASAGVTLFYGRERFGIAAPPRFRMSDKLKAKHLALWGIPAALLIAVVMRSSEPPWYIQLPAVLAGLVLSLLLLFLASLIQHRLLRPDTQAPEFLFPKTTLSDKAQSAQPPAFLAKRLSGGGLARVLSEFLASVPRSLGDGYIDYQKRVLYSGHSLMLGLFLIQLVIYVAGYILLTPGTSQWGGAVPALAYVLVLLLTLSLLFTGMAFFLDLFRVPVFITAVVWSIVMYAAFDSDHYYRLQTKKTSYVRPETAVDSWAKRSQQKSPLVVVAASGGGIQAAAWTTKVLTGLSAACGSRFDQSLAMISAVSGGSVGAMFYVNEFTGAGFRNDPDSLRAIVNKAEESSLNETAWGLVYPDTLRSIAPILVYPKTKDRGWAIEQAWSSGWSGASSNLSDWEQDLEAGRKPGIIMNSTLGESGGRYVLTNFDLPQDWDTKSLNTLYPDRDLQLTTAARLSATFPYVTPMARALFDDPANYPRFHMADGGYFDNFGVVSLVEWMNNVLPYYKSKYFGKSVVVIEIQASPRAGDRNPQKKWGFAQQQAGPVTTLLNVRTNAQLFRNQLELALVRKQWEEKGGTWKDIDFVFKNQSPPLSWHLTRKQKEDIEKNWNTYQGEKVREVEAALGCSPQNQTLRAATTRAAAAQH